MEKDLLVIPGASYFCYNDSPQISSSIYDVSSCLNKDTKCVICYTRWYLNCYCGFWFSISQ